MLIVLSFMQGLFAMIAFAILAIIYKYFIKTMLLLHHYKKQGGVTFFHKKLLGYFTNLEYTIQKGDYFHIYKEALKKNPNAPFFAENFGDKVLFVAIDSNMVKDILKKIDTYHKAMDVIGTLAELTRGSIFFNEDKVWKNQRRIISGSFSFESLRHVIPMIVEVTNEKFQDWINRGELTNMNLQNNLGDITGEVVGRFFFGKKFSEKTLWGQPFTTGIQEMFIDVGDEQFKLSTAILGAGFAKTGILPRHRKLNNQIVEFRAKCREMIMETEESIKNNENQEKNLLVHLLNLRKNGNPENQYTDEQIVGEFAALFIAGTDTTALLISSCIYNLIHYPEAFQKVKDEIDKEIRDLSSITLDDLNKLEYTTAFMKETFRYGSATGALLFRVAVKDDDLCGVQIKKGTFVNVFVPILHNIEKHYSEADKFIPERWLGDGRFNQDGFKTDGYSFLPFSAGPRNCVGQYLAMVEAKIILTLFVKRFNFKPSRKDYQMKMVQRVTFAPLDPFFIDLELKK